MKTQQRTPSPPIGHPLPAGNVSVVVVSYHTGPVLWRCIESVLSQMGLHELILVDNGNPPEVQKKLQAYANPRLRYLSGHGNVGFAKACNLGAEAAKGEYILLLNPDCVLFPDTLTKTRHALKSRPDAWMAGCSLLSQDGSEQRTCRRNILTPLTAMVESFSLYKILPKKWRLNDYPTDGDSVPAISGAFMFLKRQHYFAVGGMDESYFLHVEDLDFCLQINKKGGKVIYLPEIKAVHFLSTSDAPSSTVEWYKAKSFFRYFHKNFRSAHGVLLALYAAILVRFALKYTLIKLKNLRPKKQGITKQDILATLLHAAPDTAEGVDIARLHAMEPVLVTGTSSQIGICLVQRLLDAGIQTHAQYCSSVVDFSHPNLTWHYGNLEKHILNLDGINAQTVIHTAPIWLLPPHIKALSEAGVKRIIAFSSTSIFGKNTSKDPYDMALVQRLKEAEEALIKECGEHHIEWTILRPTMIYGLGLDTNVASITRFIKKFGFFPVASNTEGLRAPVHADDLALAALAASYTPETYGKSYNLSGGETLPYGTMVERIFQTASKKPRILPLPCFALALDVLGFITRRKHINGGIAERMGQDLVFDHSAAKKDFGYRPRSFLAPHPCPVISFLTGNGRV